MEFVLIDELIESGYSIYQDPMMKPRSCFDSESKFIFLTHIQYEYLSKYLPHSLLYRPEYLVDLGSPNKGGTIKITYDTSPEQLVTLIKMMNPEAVEYISSDHPFRDYHADYTLLELVCDQYRVKFIKSVSHVYYNSAADNLDRIFNF